MQDFTDLSGTFFKPFIDPADLCDQHLDSLITAVTDLPCSMLSPYFANLQLSRII